MSVLIMPKLSASGGGGACYACVAQMGKQRYQDQHRERPRQTDKEQEMKTDGDRIIINNNCFLLFWDRRRELSMFH